MMKITFVLPSVGRKPDEAYPRTWVMEPLAISTLSALTPPDISRAFYDDRLEPIPYDEPTDLVAISVETYTARRAYQISEHYHKRGVPVVMGGFHPTLAPEDTARHADAIVVGEAEGVWPTLLQDFAKGQLQPKYEAKVRPDLEGVFPDRTIFAGKQYMGLALVETGRGCRLSCDFCSISSFYKRTYAARPVGDVVHEIAALGKRNIFFVDDNLAVDKARALALFRAIEPLNIRWMGQISIHAMDDDKLLQAMHRSGCLGVLIGFESLSSDSAATKGKALGEQPRETYEKAIARLTRNKIAIYGTFVFGYDEDTSETVREAVEFAMRHRFFFAAFNHLVPFPGTPLYRRLAIEKRLLQDAWWLAPGYRFGDLAFQPASMSAPDLADACLRARRSFYAWPRVIKRSMNIRANCRSPFLTVLFLASNLLSGRDVEKRQGMPLGSEE